jgi:hypothetical protein
MNSAPILQDDTRVPIAMNLRLKCRIVQSAGGSGIDRPAR